MPTIFVKTGHNDGTFKGFPADQGEELSVCHANVLKCFRIVTASAIVDKKHSAWNNDFLNTIKRRNHWLKKWDKCY